MSDDDHLDFTQTGFGETKVVAHIRPPLEEGSERVFQIKRRTGYYGDGDTCRHLRYFLNEEWSTVKCVECGERLDPFAVLMHHATWEVRMDNRRVEVERAEEWMLRESLRRLRRLVDTTDDERAEVVRVLDDYRTKLDDLRETAHRIEPLVRKRQDAKSAARREKRRSIRTV